MIKNKFLACLLLMAVTVIPSMAAVRDTVSLVRIENKAEKRIKRIHAIYFDVSGNLPSAETTLGKNVETWFAKTLSGELGVSIPAEYGNADGLLSAYSKGFLSQGRKEVIDLLKLEKEQNDTTTRRITYTYNATIDKVYETGGFITFLVESYVYMGGAHGAQYKTYGTFRKDNGTLLTWNDLFLPKKLSTIRVQVADALKGYFGVMDFAAMREKLLIDGNYSRSTFPLPAGNPGLLAEGLQVQYADYEIAPHAAGMPSANISYDKLKNCWTAEARKLWRK